MLVMVDEVGILLFHLSNRFKLPSLAEAVVYFPQSQRSYISGPLIKPDEGEQLPSSSNSIRIWYEEFYLDSRRIDSSLTKVASAPYFEAWLTRNITNYSWYINFFNYLSSNHSKEIETVPLVEHANCIHLYHDQFHSDYPRSLSFLVFCISFNQEALLWRLSLALFP